MKTGLFLVALLALGMGGCATINPKINVRHFGRMDPDLDARTAKNAESARRGGLDASQVEVVSGQLPEGLSLEENGSRLVARPGAGQTYEVLGEVEVDYGPAVAGATARNMYWTWPYEEGWRKGYCYPQVPLKILTLGLWYLVPLGWPCMAVAPGDTAERERALLGSIRHGTAAMGGNLAVVVAAGQMTYVTVSGNKYSATGVVNTVKSTSLKAFAVRRRSSASLPPAGSGGPRLAGKRD